MSKKNLPDFMRMQFDFAGWIRNPKEGDEPLGLEARRMNIYKELFFNNVEGFCSTAFPVTKDILDEKWLGYVTDFFKKHRCETPYFREISEEFLAFMQAEEDLPPCLVELMHYEWVELALSVDTAEHPDIQELSEIEDVKLKLNPLAWVLAYNYPVHQISSDYIPNDVAPTLLLVHRNIETDIKFILLDATTFFALKALEEQSLTINEVIETLQAQHNIQLDKEQLEVQIRRFVEIGVLYI